MDSSVLPKTSSSESKTDRFWWLPILLVLVLPFCGEPLITLHDWFFPPPPPVDNGEIHQTLCFWVFFLDSIPGKLIIVCILTAPAIVLLLKRTGLRKGWMFFSLVAYLMTAAIGLIGTIRFVGYKLYTNSSGLRIIGSQGTPHLTAIPPDTVMASMLLAMTLLAICLAFIALILGLHQKKILLRTILTPILSILFIMVGFNIILTLGGGETACSPGKIITTP